MAFRLLATFAVAAPPLGGFWQLTDVHIDQLKECSGTDGNWYGSFDGQYGCGCTVETVNATTKFMHSTMANPDFIIFSGDATASGEILSNINLIQDMIRAQFPNTQLFLVLGNHDFPGLPVGQDALAWYKTVGDSWGNDWLNPAAAAMMSSVGYYTQPLVDAAGKPTKGRFVALNTELFNHGNDAVVAGQTIQEALEHLDWINATLTAAKQNGERAYIVGHVPIGIETGYLNDQRVPSALRPYWLDLYARKYQDILDSFGEDVVAAQIFGHEHTDTFRLLGEKTVGLTAPSLSTAYPRTNPTVRLWRHNATSVEVLDYDQYYMDLLNSNAAHTPIFKHSYSFREEYGLSDLSRHSLEQLVAQWETDASMNRRTGIPGWLCADERDGGAIYIEGRSLSKTDPGFGATLLGCDSLCSTTDGCKYYQWGHHTPDFVGTNGTGIAWCYLMRTCGGLVADDSNGTKYTPLYSVRPRNASSSSGGSTNTSSYDRALRFFMSSTPVAVQPLCNSFCQVLDLCDKTYSAVITSDECFTECVENSGQQLFQEQQKQAAGMLSAVHQEL